MKILCIIENYPPYIIGGAELTQHAYHRYLTKTQGIEFTVLTGINEHKDPEVEGIHVHRVLRGMKDFHTNPLTHIFNTIYNIFVILKYSVVHKPDIIEFVPNNYSLIPILYLFSRAKLPIIISVHSHILTAKNNSIFDWTQKAISSIIQSVNNNNIHIITISNFMKKTLTNHGVNLSKITTIYNPIENTYKGYPSNGKVVFASRLEKDKGVEYILREFSELHDIPLEIYGDGSMKNLVEQYAEKYSNIQYHGKVSEAEVIDAIGHCHCIIAHPMYDEPFGRYILHSVSMMKPLICSRSGAVPEIIQSGDNGILTDKGDTHAIKQEILKLYKDASLYKRITSNLRDLQPVFEISSASKKRFACYKNILTI